MTTTYRLLQKRLTLLKKLGEIPPSVNIRGNSAELRVIWDYGLTPKQRYAANTLMINLYL